MIRDVVIHLSNEQPLVADLYDMPTTADVALVCTNLRMLNGKRPVFIDAIDSVFLFPLVHIRFVEIPSRAGGAPERGDESAVPAAPTEPAEPDLELDEDFLRRVREV